jgi:hypothetical protein
MRKQTLRSSRRAGRSMALALTAAVILTIGAVNVADAAPNAVVAATDPGAPLIGAATTGDGQATVNFTAPGTDGGTAITSYTVTATDSTTRPTEERRLPVQAVLSPSAASPTGTPTPSP